MKKYIDAEAAKFKVAVETAEAGAGHATDAGFISFLLGFRTLFDANIDEMPAADVQEVIHGEWKEETDEYMICATEFTCSVCNKTFCSSELTDKEFYEMMKHCPNCGAKMDGKEKT